MTVGLIRWTENMLGIQIVALSKDVLDLETLVNLRCQMIKAACFLVENKYVLHSSKPAAVCELLSADTGTQRWALFFF